MPNISLKDLLNLRCVRAVLRDQSIETVERVLGNVEQVLKMVREREEHERNHPENIRSRSIREEIRARYDSRMHRRGKPVPPKYRYEIDGEVRTWTGRGRTPLDFAELLRREGKSREEYLINPPAAES